MKPDRSSRPAGPQDLTARTHRTTSVFVADDDRDFRDLARVALSAAGYEVIMAADGGEALERLAALVDAHTPLPDVLVLDFVMPRLSGLGVLGALCSLGRVPPTLVITGFADPSVDTFARNLGAFRVLRKPFNDDELCAAVAEAVASRAPARQ
jgi:CheY-like chemotaxis protein